MGHLICATELQHQHSTLNSMTFHANIVRIAQENVPKGAVKLSGGSDTFQHSAFDKLCRVVRIPDFQMQPPFKAELTLRRYHNADAKYQMEQLCISLKPLVELMARDQHSSVQEHYGVDYCKEPNSRDVIPRTCYILREICQGIPMDELMKLKKGIPSELTVIQYAKEILEGLEFLHSNRIIHCDLRGANVIVSETRTLKISGLNMAKHFKEPGTPPSLIKAPTGTIPFISPEMASLAGASSNKLPHVGRNTDVWSYGCVVLQMLQKGEPPNVYRQPPGIELNDFQRMHDYFQKNCNQFSLPTPNACGHGCRPPCALVSNELLMLVKDCLIGDRACRPSASTVLADHWMFLNYRAEFVESDPQRLAVKRYSLETISEIQRRQTSTRPTPYGTYADTTPLLRDVLKIDKRMDFAGVFSGHVIPGTLVVLSPLSTSTSSNFKDLQKLDLQKKRAVYEILMGADSKTQRSDNVIKHLALSELYDNPPELRVLTEIEGTMDPLNCIMKEKGFDRHSLIAQFAKQIIIGLNFLHSSNIVHCDIRCKNIFVKPLEDRSYLLKIARFEKAAYLDEGMSLRHPQGSSEFASKEMQELAAASLRNSEILKRVTVGNATDVYSLGCTVLEMFLGNPPKWTYSDNCRKTTYDFIFDVNAAAFEINLVNLWNHHAFPDVSTEVNVPDVSVEVINLSEQSKDFIENCFREACDRPTCTELLLHPFIEEAGTRTNVEPSTSNAKSNVRVNLLNKTLVLTDEEIRHCICTVLHAAVTEVPCHGGIFLDNIFYTEVVEQSSPSKLRFSLGDQKNTTDLWTEWIATVSNYAYAVYIPPECLTELPDSNGNTSKVDSWALGCLLAHLLNCGESVKPTRKHPDSRDSEAFQQADGNFLFCLQKFSENIDGEMSVYGPEIRLRGSISYACEEFLARCLEIDPSKRWSLSQLKELPYIDQSMSLKDLAEDELKLHQPDQTVAQLQSTTDITLATSRSTNPFEVVPYALRNTNPEGVDNSSDSKKAELLRVSMRNGQGKANHDGRFGRVLDLLAMHYYEHRSSRIRGNAKVHLIRALQTGYNNVVHHFGYGYCYRQEKIEFQVLVEHSTGETFDIAAGYYLPISVMRKWLESVLRGLEFLHSHGTAHGNLRGSMIHFSQPNFRGTVRIGDFFSVPLKTRNVPVDGLNADRTMSIRNHDIWSIGCIAVYLATGVPMAADSSDGPNDIMGNLQQVTKKGRHVIPKWVPVSLAQIISRCLVVNPSDMPSAAELLNSKEPDSLFTQDPESTDYQPGRSTSTEKPPQKLPDSTVLYWKREIPEGRFVALEILKRFGFRAKETLFPTHLYEAKRSDTQKVTMVTKVLDSPRRRVNVRAAQCMDHQNILPHLHWQLLRELTTTKLQILTKLYEGGRSLHDRLKAPDTEQPLHHRYDLLRKWTRQLVDGLGYLHRMHCASNDARAENIVLTTLSDDSCSLKIGDLSNMTQLTKEIDQNTYVERGWRHASPERCRGDWLEELRDPDPAQRERMRLRSDVWSVGCVVLEMLTSTFPQFVTIDSGGERQYVKSNTRVLHLVGRGVRPEIPESIEGNKIPKEIIDFIDKCLQVEVINRPDVADLHDYDMLNKDCAEWSN